MKSGIITILGVPKAVQSFRFTKEGRKYQPKEVVSWKNLVRITAMRQYAGKPILADIPVSIDVEFVFPPPKSWSKSKRKALESGAVIYKVTKPDLTDNLKKALIDALSGVCWERDQQICREKTAKFYGTEPRTVLYFEEIENAQIESPNLEDELRNEILSDFAHE